MYMYIYIYSTSIEFGNLEASEFFAEGDALSVFSELHQCGVSAASDQDCEQIHTHTYMYMYIGVYVHVHCTMMASYVIVLIHLYCVHTICIEYIVHVRILHVQVYACNCMIACPMCVFVFVHV